MKQLLITRGQFFVLTASTVFVALLSEEQTAKYFDALEIAEETRAPDVYRVQVYQRVFSSDAIAALPAYPHAALYDYAEHYTGLHQDLVRGIAACILTGTPFSKDGENKNGGGSGDRLPKPPKSPRTGGCALVPPQAVKS